jgi:hypothetical protein
VDARGEGGPAQRDKEVLSLAEAIANLAKATRKARTSLWSSLQATVLREIHADLDGGEAKTKDSTALPVALVAETDTCLNNDNKMMKLEENKDVLEELLLKI